MYIRVHTHLTGRANENNWKLVHNPSMLKPRGTWTDLIIPRAKPVVLLSQGNWGMGQLKSRPQTKSHSAMGAASPGVPRQEN